jgi:hypothetical protein
MKLQSNSTRRMHATLHAALVAVKMKFLVLPQQNPCGTRVFGPPARALSTNVLILDKLSKVRFCFRPSMGTALCCTTLTYTQEEDCDLDALTAPLALWATTTGARLLLEWTRVGSSPDAS